jgi:hypothetical protein
MPAREPGVTAWPSPQIVRLHAEILDADADARIVVAGDFNATSARRVGVVRHRPEVPESDHAPVVATFDLPSRRR